MRCKKHPTYEAIRKPRAHCDRCLLLWLSAQMDRMTTQLNALRLEIDEAREREREGWI